MTSIAVMFIMIIAGYILGRTRTIPSDKADVLSAIVLYTGAPAAIVSSLQIELTAERLNGWLLATAAGALINFLYILIARILAKRLGFSAMERCSIIYSNAGNLVIPLVTMILGTDMVFYCTGFMMAQTVLFWTHCKTVMSRQPSMDWKKILTNVNMIAIALGLILFLTNIRLPAILQTAISTMAGTMAPISMFVIGIVLSGADLKKVFANRRSWLVCLFRLIVFPLLAMALLFILRMPAWIPNGTSVLMITMLAASAPSASTVSQFATIYHNEEEHASAINAMSVILCIVTMPIINMIYNAAAGRLF